MHRQQQIGGYSCGRLRTGGTFTPNTGWTSRPPTAGRTTNGDDEIGDPSDWHDDQIREMACFLLGIDTKHAAKVDVVRD